MRSAGERPQDQSSSPGCGHSRSFGSQGSESSAPEVDGDGSSVVGVAALTITGSLAASWPSTPWPARKLFDVHTLKVSPAVARRVSR